MKKDITHLFYFVSNFIDDYQKAVKAKAIKNEYLRKPTRLPILSDAEIVTIILLFQESPSKNSLSISHPQSSYNWSYHPDPAHKRQQVLD